MRGDRALVTGASAGIGAAFADRLAEEGYSLVLVARREERLRERAATLRERWGVEVEVVVADLASAGGRARVRDVCDIGTPLAMVVLNAGFGAIGSVSAIGRERQVEMVALNCEAVVDLACHVLPGMIARRRGDLIVVSSAAAWQPIPFTATYAATKAFELFFVEALERELVGTGVRVIASCPGPVATEFGAVAGSGGGAGWIPHESADRVVEVTLAALRRGRVRVATGWLAKITTSAATILPRHLVVRAAGAVHRRLGRH